MADTGMKRKNWLLWLWPTLGLIALVLIIWLLAEANAGELTVMGLLAPAR